jgi:membrane-associated phospholipid phosphatase
VAFILKTIPDFCGMRWKWFKSYKTFWWPVFTGILLLACLVLFGHKADTFFALQLPHSELLNVVFSVITWMGDGLFCVLAVLLFALFVSTGRALCLASGYIAGSLVVQLGKLVFFKGTPRPIKWLELNRIVHELPQGLEPHLWNSFPSGHSASAMALFFLLATQVQSSKWRFFLGIMAIVTGYSRIYLYMHFPEDVLAGFIVGALTMVPLWIIWSGYLAKTKHSWMQRPLLKWRN